MLIDDSAIGTDQAKKFVLVVDNTSHVQYREITPGNLHDGLRVVAQGLKPGDRIVVNGIEHARPRRSDPGPQRRYGDRRTFDRFGRLTRPATPDGTSL